WRGTTLPGRAGLPRIRTRGSVGLGLSATTIARGGAKTELATCESTFFCSSEYLFRSARFKNCRVSSRSTLVGELPETDTSEICREWSDTLPRASSVPPADFHRS